MNALPFNHTMALLVGTLLAGIVGMFATLVGLDRDRAFYPTAMIVIALLYVLFAAMGASTHAVIVESLIGVIFIVSAVFGFKSSLWIVVAALASHGIFDLIHGAVVANPGVPKWWPEFCSTYDVAAAGYLALLLKSGRINSAATHRAQAEQRIEREEPSAC